MKKYYLLILFLFLNMSNVYAANITPQQQILNSLANSEECWNKGDLRGFMDVYVKSEQILFISGTSFVHGWQESYQHYIKKYGNAKQNMGQLHIKIESIRLLDKEHAFAYGRYHLKTANATYDGVTSLILEKDKERWRIMIDHSNS